MMHLLAKSSSPRAVGSPQRAVPREVGAPDIGPGNADTISAVVLTYNEAAFVARCLASVLAFDTPGRRLEVIVVDGGSTDGTVDALRGIAARASNMRIVHNARRIKPVGLNLGIAASTGAWIVRIDAHAVYPRDYAVRCIEAASRTGSANAGGRVVPVAGVDGVGARLVQSVTTHVFGVGRSVFRVGGAEGDVDTVPFGCFRRDALRQVGLFNERLVHCQDYELNCRLRRDDLRIWFVPGIEIRYFNKSAFWPFLKKSCLRDGRWNPFMWYEAGYTFRWRHAVPLVAAALGIALGAASLAGVGRSLLAGAALTYVAAALVASGQQAVRLKTWWLVPLLPAAFAGYHVAYGLGSVLGCVELLLGIAPVQRGAISGAVGVPKAPEPDPAKPEPRVSPAKRAMDVVAAAIVLLLSSPVLALAAVAIKLEDGGPVCYRGVRAGLGGKPFSMLKLRTMVLDAERRGGPSTADDDPRLTRTGAELRRWKVDELPQLLNVLRGEMSLVGPRPQVLGEVANYTDEERQLLSVPPGITDYASILFRNEGELLTGQPDPDEAYARLIRPEKMRLGLQYVREHSLRTDLTILARTIAALCR